MKRRTFLRAGAAGVAGAMAGAGGLLAWSPRAHAATVTRTLYITEGFTTQPDGVDVYARSFADADNRLQVPGAPFIVQEGDTVSVTIVNTLGTTHSFVIPGMVDSGPIAGGETRTVTFTADRVGSHLYHDGENAPYNRLVGLHGGFAVMPSGSGDELYAGSPTFRQQYTWVMTEIDPAWHERVRNGRTPNTAYTPRYFTINGRSMRVPGHPDYGNPDIDAGYAPDTRLSGSVGDRSLVRILNAGMAMHSVHFHANHVEWLARNGQPRADVWRKDTLMLPNDMGSLDVIYPFEPPPDAWPPVSTGYYPMHLHDEMTQTAGGGFYQFGLATTIAFK